MSFCTIPIFSFTNKVVILNEPFLKPVIFCFLFMVLSAFSAHGKTLGILGDRHPDVLYSVNTDQPIIALTIDDGPDPVSTPLILDALAKNNATATFFIIADRIPGNEALLENIVHSGHEIGNHLTHDEPSIDLSPEAFEGELTRSHTVLSEYDDVTWFRPGSGWYDDGMIETLAKHNYRCALGSIYPLDPQIPSSWFAEQIIVWMADPGDIIILHDSGSRGLRTARTLKKILPKLQEKGYRVVSLRELISLTCESDKTENKKPSSDPLNATYQIDGLKISLTDGLHEQQAAPGSVTEVRTTVFGTPLYGDLNDDGTDDAALILVHQPGGSGTFYYVAAALKEQGTYTGTNAVLLGDRIALQNVTIRNGVLVVEYADRRLENSMATPPSIEKSKYLTIKAGSLTALDPLEEGEQVFEGWATIGHEVRSFVPCSSKKLHWIQGNSPALNTIAATYAQALPNAKPYTPLFMILAGTIVEPSEAGFGADYDDAFYTTRLVQVAPKGNCRSEFIVVDSPTPGALISSPLAIRGRARGTWFFEGDFPVALSDAAGNTIGSSFVTAQGEWMTQEFVPFKGTLEFTNPVSRSKGTLILKKDNPSDNRELDDAVEIPIFFE